ncbi:MAG: glycosyltransferase family 2 protein [Candidatus Avilachnospira sp.]|jgi:GT2 family glycosyltransferase
MKYRLDVTRLREGMMTLNGWAIPKKSSNSISYEIRDDRGAELKIKYVPMKREDVAAIYKLEDTDLGFDIEFPYERGRDYFLIIKEREKGALGEQGRELSSVKIKINEEIIAKRNSVSHRKREKLLALLNMETVKVAWDFFKENGARALVKKSVHKLQGISEDYDYSEWYEKTRVTKEELEGQRRELKEAGELPLISIVIPAYNTPEKYLRMLYDSLKAQTYENFEVCIGDGSEGDGTVERVTLEYAKKDDRFKYKKLQKNLGISENTNAALAMAKGDFTALCDHDDELPPEALYEIYKAIRENPKALLIYTDEDKVDFDGKAYFEPHFKSDYNPDLLTSVNYICHLTVLKRELLEKVGGFRHEYDGAQDYDFFLRCCEEATAEEKKRLKLFYELIKKEAEDKKDINYGNRSLRRDREYTAELSRNTGLSEKAVEKLLKGEFVSETVIHVRKVCYHWRCHKNSTSFNPESKLYAFEAGKRAIMDHYRRTGVKAESVEDGVTYGFYHSILGLPEDCEQGEEKVSVIIPNKDHTADLDKCLRSLILNSSVRRLEFVIVENNSTEKETEEYYRKIEGNPAYFTEGMRDNSTSPKTGDNYPDTPDISDIEIKIARWPREFNYSAINNFGVLHSTGKYLLFLNNDVELIAPDSIKEMLSLMQRDEVGVCGARLLYEDDTIQHAGVVVGFGGIAGGCFIGLHEKENSYMHRAMCSQDYSAVTAACLMTKRDVFMSAGGFYEGLAVAFNDIDYCMSVRSMGKLVVYDPYVSFHHYESKSRGLEDTPEKVERFNGEIAVFADRWGDILADGDPYYNPNLTLRKSNFALRDLTKEKPGEPYKLELDIKKQLQVVEREKKRREAELKES